MLFHLVNIIRLHNLLIVEEEPGRFTSRGMFLAYEGHIVPDDGLVMEFDRNPVTRKLRI